MRKDKTEFEVEHVDHPAHYQGSIECIDAMVAAYGKCNTANFCQINAFKYVWRAGKKADNSFTQDLKKAVWYLNKAIELVEE